MIIVAGWPPNIDAIDSVFKVRARPAGNVVFAYGDRIYVPNGGPVSPHIAAHEAAHGTRQRGMGVDRWWDRYLVDAAFRLDEEIVGHRAEYRALCTTTKDRELCNRHLSFVAGKLASTLYGSLISVARARAEVKR